jgi:hypothetical protein
MTAGPSHVPDVSFRRLTASRVLSYQGCPRALDHGPRRAQRRPAPAQPDGSALREVRSVRRPTRSARYGHSTGAGTGAQMPARKSATITGHRPRPRRIARVHPLESVMRLLRRRIDDTGGNLPRAWRNSISIDAGCRRFPAILPNSVGFVPGLAGNTMLPAYCSRDPSGVKARFKRVLRKEHACRVITTAPGRQLRAAE